MTAKKAQKELYLKIPYHILNLRGVGLSEKVLLAHIYSFGVKGCWQSNATLAEIFMTSTRTISLWLGHIVQAELVQIKSPKGYYRTIWAKSHPEVRSATHLHYRQKKTSKTGPEQNEDVAGHCAKNCAQDRQNCALTAQNLVIECAKTF